MSKFSVVVDEVKVYEADAEELKTRWPDEYAQWVEKCEESGEEPTDKGWVADCVHEGGPDLGEMVQFTQEIEIREKKNRRP